MGISAQQEPGKASSYLKTISHLLILPIKCTIASGLLVAWSTRAPTDDLWVSPTCMIIITYLQGLRVEAVNLASAWQVAITEHLGALAHRAVAAGYSKNVSFGNSQVTAHFKHRHLRRHRTAFCLEIMWASSYFEHALRVTYKGSGVERWRSAT